MKSQPASCLMPQRSQSHSNAVSYQRLTLLLHYEGGHNIKPVPQTEPGCWILHRGQDLQLLLPAPHPQRTWVTRKTKFTAANYELQGSHLSLVLI